MVKNEWQFVCGDGGKASMYQNVYAKKDDDETIFKEIMPFPKDVANGWKVSEIRLNTKAIPLILKKKGLESECDLFSYQEADREEDYINVPFSNVLESEFDNEKLN